MSTHNNDNAPSDECFKLNFEKILNSPQGYDFSTDVTIPILDETISHEEVCL